MNSKCKEVLEAEKNARNFFTSQVRRIPKSYNGTSAYYLETEDKIVISSNATICHASILKEYPARVGGMGLPGYPEVIIKPKALAFASNSTHEHQAYYEFWKWITNKETSPWKKIFDGPDNLEELYNGDQFVGFLLPHHVFKRDDIPWPLIIDFVVAARAPCDTHNTSICFWKLLVDKGVHPSDAFVISTFFGADPNRNSISKVMINTNHWPLNLGSNFCIQRFREGDPFPDPISTTACFSNSSDYDKACVEGSRGFDFIHNTFQRIGKLKAGSFSEYLHYELDDIVEAFYAQVVPFFTGARV